MSRELENLVKIGQLKAEPGTRAEFEGLVSSGRKRLADASHALALAALRLKGYARKIAMWFFSRYRTRLAWMRPFGVCWQRRTTNSEIDERLLADLIHCATQLEKAVTALDPPTAG